MLCVIVAYSAAIFAAARVIEIWISRRFVLCACTLLNEHEQRKKRRDIQIAKLRLHRRYRSENSSYITREIERVATGVDRRDTPPYWYLNYLLPSPSISGTAHALFAEGSLFHQHDLIRLRTRHGVGTNNRGESPISVIAEAMQVSYLTNWWIGPISIRLLVISL